MQVAGYRGQPIPWDSPSYLYVLSYLYVTFGAHWGCIAIERLSAIAQTVPEMWPEIEGNFVQNSGSAIFSIHTDTYILQDRGISLSKVGIARFAEQLFICRSLHFQSEGMCCLIQIR